MKNQFTTKAQALASESDGRRLAVAMLNEFRASDTDKCSIEPRFRSGRPQLDIFTRYRRIVSDCLSPAVAAGFDAVLCDHLACAADGGVIDNPDYYNNLDEHGNERGFSLGVTALVPRGRATPPTAPRRRRRVTTPKLRAVK
jgi:hypothetical protein